jgi:ATP synthase F1 gamma subunit
MPSLKDLRNRISSVKATQKITKAMQMVAAAKLRRAQAAAEAARPYAERMESVWRSSPLAYQQAVRSSLPVMAKIMCTCLLLRLQSAGYAVPLIHQSFVLRVEHITAVAGSR